MSSEFLQICTKDQLYEFFAEFNASEESVQNDVKYLKEWIRKQAHLPTIEDDEWLTNFLLRCKNSLEKTKKVLDGYYTTRTLMPEVFQDRDPCTKQIEHVFRQGGYVPTTKLTPDGYRIVIFRIFDDSKNSIPDPESIIKATQISTDYSLKVDKIRGMIVIYDFQNITMNYITMMFSILKKLLTLATKTTPCRYHKIYILNLIPAVEPIISFGKSLVKKELADRVQVWKDDPKKLITVLPKEVLPANYGGTEKPLEELKDRWYEEIKNYQDWFISDEKNKADLNKKPVDSSYANNDVTNYGIEGSFRKICLD
ncbi:alpha-tocopherol transfer protein-like [Planococcus citri]|uniref:alpha-tocopherol transfer protein-like n=1 Tax=Planococcus citri TaxID=170843 RepID=UPI0031F9823E